LQDPDYFKGCTIGSVSLAKIAVPISGHHKYNSVGKFCVDYPHFLVHRPPMGWGVVRDRVSQDRGQYVVRKAFNWAFYLTDAYAWKASRPRHDRARKSPKQGGIRLLNFE